MGAKDVALYFVHWLTDLAGEAQEIGGRFRIQLTVKLVCTEAGAEPTPLGGCEKFVIKFPLHVHNLMLQELKKSLRHLENV